jgi:putative ABC transport system substrate-binding protein
VTGASFYTSPVVTKRLDLARELVPEGSVIATLINPTNPPSVEEARSLQAAAAALGQRLLILQASTLGQLQDAFATMKQQQVRALIVSSDPFFFSERVKLVVLMARDALPTIFADREQADAGGLMSYGASRSDAYRQAGNYVGRIVKGEKPAELPVILATKFHLLVNLKTARSLAIDVPATVLAHADKVIEKERAGRSAVVDKDIIIGRVINVTGMVGVSAGIVLLAFGIVLLLIRRGLGFDIPLHWFW